MSRQSRACSTLLSIVAVPAILLAGCGGASPPSTGQSARDAVPAALHPDGSGTVISTPAPELPTPESATCDAVEPFSAAAFPGVPRIDNADYPLRPGMQFLLDGTAVDANGVKQPHRIETTVTDLTKMIDGVRTVVVFDRDLEGSQVQESEIYFEAQDRSGSVWNLGEYPEEYANGTLKGAPKSWLPGVAGATPGIAMPAHPQAGTPTYNEGLAASVGFKDCATVVETGRYTCAGPRCYDAVVVVDEYAPLQRGDGHQEKFMAPGIGTVRVAAAGGADPEELQLTSAHELCAPELASVDALALQEDQRAFAMRRDLWGGTTPAERTLTAEGC